MSTNENKDIVSRQWYQELWNNWNIAVADDLFSTDYTLHLSGSPPINREGAKQVVAMFRAAFPDLKHTVEEMVGEGNSVAVRWTVRGTHQGAFQGIAATGKQVVLSGTTVHHLGSGRIVETWLSMDNLDLLQQLGAIPRSR